MTPALKDIGRISELLGVSPLSQSTIWNQLVYTIKPAQLLAFEKRHSLMGKRDLAESSVDIAQAEVQKAVARNEIDIPVMLSYVRPARTHLTAGELRDGLLRVGKFQTAAILFGLETKMDSMMVSTLTHQRLNLAGELSPLARKCLSLFPRHIRSPYVFWDQSKSDGRVTPLYGLDVIVFETFGLLWGELAFGYENLIMIDTNADRVSFEYLVHR